MTDSTHRSETPVPSPPPAKPGGALKKPQRGRPVERKEPISREAGRFAAAILEVLAGLRTPNDAAAALGISVPRYYLWEQRALEGMVAACEPRGVGKVASARSQIAALEKETARLRQECARQQALVRAAQRTIGLTPPPLPKPVSKATTKRPRKRRPAVRALKALSAIQGRTVMEEVPAGPAGMPPAEVLQPSALSNPMPSPASAEAALRAVGG